DEEHGGFGRRPKFPNTMALELLLRGRRPGDRERACRALDAMRAGGIWDHLGGGFHRYSTDERWLVPHFEKMLYDNALLMRLYADAWRATGAPVYAQTAREIAAYVAREMTAPDGGFYATQDADSEGHEGKFFTWTPAEIDAACGEDIDAARVAKAAYGVDEQGNFEDSDASVLSRSASDDGVTRALGWSASGAERVASALERARAHLFAARERRIKPSRDEKILASWNGLMAGALAAAGSALGDGPMVQAAVRAMRFVERTLVSPEGDTRARVLRHCKDGVARGAGFLDDHAFVADAAIDLYESTADPSWVHLARRLAEAIRSHFYDMESDSFFFTPDDGEAILVRPRDPFDHAVPSGPAIAARVFMRLGGLVDVKLAELGARAVERLAGAALDNPLGMSVTVALADRLVRGSVDVVLIGPPASPATTALAAEAHRAYLPDRVVAWADPADPRALEACSLLAEGKAVQPEPVAYVCRGRTCSLPIAAAAPLRAALES
ncbi:MAG: thioredoxin domain-containing protein, partial [Polyangiaceae bacterium]|nr:thioredoxin domain-containing protein [Polyangiaceae bacterium]